MKIGYARIRTKSQNLQSQIAVLKKNGCKKIFNDDELDDQQQGERTGLINALLYVKKDDVLVVCSLDRLCLSVRELINISHELDSKGVYLHSLAEGIDTSTPDSKVYFNLLNAIEQMKSNLIQERIEVSRQKGHSIGRKKMSEDKISKAKLLLAGGASYPEVAEAIGVGLSTLYKYIPKNS